MNIRRPAHRAPRVRLTVDTPFVVGMILADEDGNETAVSYVSARGIVTVDGGGFSGSFVRARWPFIVKGA